MVTYVNNMNGSSGAVSGDSVATGNSAGTGNTAFHSAQNAVYTNNPTRTATNLAIKTQGAYSYVAWNNTAATYDVISARVYIFIPSTATVSADSGFLGLNTNANGAGSNVITLGIRNLSGVPHFAIWENQQLPGDWAPFTTGGELPRDKWIRVEITANNGGSGSTWDYYTGWAIGDGAFEQEYGGNSTGTGTRVVYVPLGNNTATVGTELILDDSIWIHNTSGTASYPGVASPATVQPSTSTPVSSNPVQDTWNVKSLVADTESTQWNVRSKVTDTNSTDWNVRTSVLDSNSTDWGVRTRVSDTETTSWTVQSIISDANSTAWGVKTLISDSESTTWGVRNPISDSESTNWGVRTVISDSNSTSWDTFATAAVSNSNSTSWNVRQTVSDAQGTDWGVRTSVIDTNASSWTVKSVVLDSIATSWIVNQTVSVSTSVSDAWGVRTTTADTQNTSWAVREALVDAQGTSWAVRSRVLDSESTLWGVRTRISDSEGTIWGVRSKAVKDNSTAWNIASPAVTYINSAEGGTQGAQVTTGNSGVGGNAFNLVTGITYFTNNVGGANGSSMAFEPQTMAGVQSVGWEDLSGGTKAALRSYVRLGSYPSSTNYIHRLGNASQALGWSGITPGGILVSRFEGAGATTSGSSQIPLNTWVRIETRIDTVTGQTTSAWFLGSSMTPGDTVTDSDTANSQSVTQGTFGKLLSTANNTVNFDDLAFRLNASQFIGPAGGKVDGSQGTTWGVRTIVTDSQGTVWAVREKMALPAVKDTAWSVRGKVSDSADTLWGVRTRLSPVTRSTDWGVRVKTAVDAAYDFWDVFGTMVPAEVYTDWDVRELVTDSVQTNWRLGGALRVYRTKGSLGGANAPSHAGGNVGNGIIEGQTNGSAVLSDSAMEAALGGTTSTRTLTPYEFIE